MGIKHQIIVDDNAVRVLISSLQHREWVLWRMADGRSDRNLAAARILESSTNEKVIENRFERVVLNCPVLRLGFDSNEPYASVAPEVTAPLAVGYARPDEDLAGAIARLANEIGEKPFLFSEIPALRAMIVHARTAEKCESALLLVAHPIIADRVSLDRLLAIIDSNPDIEAVDEAFLALTEKIDSIEGQADNDQKLAFFKELLKDAPLQMDLPTDRTRPPVFRNEGDSVEIEIPSEVQEAVVRLASAEKTDVAAVSIAALSAYLSRLTRQQDIVMGLATDLRPAGCEMSIGPFENTTVLRVRIGDRLTGLALIGQVRDSLAALEPFRDLPFEALVQALEPDRDPSRTPIFQVHFAHRKRQHPRACLPVPTTRVVCDLEAVLEERGQALVLRLCYPEAIFERETMHRMAGHLVELLKALCAQPQEPVKALPVCTPGERAWILSTLGVQKHFQGQATIHGLVAAAAKRTPDAIAICAGNAQLSYGELNRRANQLSHRLRSLGVGRDVGVAVCMERSAELVIALLAILKAGGAYIPIEPANPKERMEFVLTDSGAHLMLTEPAQKDSVASVAITTVVLEPGGAAFSAEPTTDPEEAADPHGLAYIIYTSGSTGRPKGVLIEHYNVVRLFQATHAWFGFDENDVWTMFHSVAFDFSVWEIWGALIYGGRLVIVPYLVSRSPRNFYELLAHEKVTVLNQTPSAFRQLIQSEAEAGPRELALRLVIFGGEALEFESLRPWFQRHGDRSPRLVNMYGITETCVHVTYRPVCMADINSGLGASIIGVPIPDLSAYVVDEFLQLLPPGIPGELVVGGSGLARGYIGRPELTRERFVPDPFSSLPDARLYRSGDLVRLLPTGELDYLGRIDQQVKIRGFRVELGEIEAVLRRSGRVRDVTVLPWQSPSRETLLVAYVVSDQPSSDFREVARASLPEHMVPAHFVSVPVIPMTTNGKVDRKALPEPTPGKEGGPEVFVAPADELERIIAAIWCEVLGADRVSTRQSFFNVGGTSLGVVRVAAELKKRLDRDISVVTLFQYTTVAELAKYLSQADEQPKQAPLLIAEDRAPQAADELIAVVGMAGRFQGADDVEALWHLLVNGKEAISFFEEKDLDPTIDQALIANSSYVKARGILAGAEYFDAAFFGMSPREAQVTDPQHRVLMELAWETLEHAGVDPSSFSGLIGTYAGVYNNTYYLENVLKRHDIMADVGSFQAMLGNEKDFVATRIAHRLDLKGPAISIHTACSTSLVAVAQAFYALRTGQCDLALAGGAAVTCPQKSGYLYQEGGMLSPDGHTRPFDEQARGTVFSDGAAMVALRRLSDAIASGNTIYAVIRGAATNNDGGQRMSFSAPTVEGQAGVIAAALSVARVHPETIGYIEAHGTATPLGDPIEVEALKQAFGKWTSRRGFCALGSIKSNVGHLTAAAGVAGLIKVILSLNRERLPATLGYTRPNPAIDFSASPFYVAAKLQSWPKRPGHIRRAGVSSFGVGGTNAHVIVEEGSEQPRSGPSRTRQLLVLSAKTDSALQTMTTQLAAHLEAHPEFDLPDIAFTLQSGRKPFAFRRCMVASNLEEARARLRTPGARAVFTGKAKKQAPSVVFLFPGQGAQHIDMGRDLYNSEAVFREEVDRCAQILKPLLDLDLRTVLYPIGAKRKKEESPINQTWLAQPALFVVEYALARLWMSWGVMPSVLIGHSIGEYVAAVLAGTFTLDDALDLLSVRARLMQALPAGSMLTVRADAEKIESLLPAGTSIAAYNSPVLSVVSGPTDVLETLKEEIEAKGIVAKFLYTSHAFHSAMMEPMLPEFAIEAARIPAQAPKLPWISTCHGRWMGAQDIAGGEYWVRQIRRPVRLAQALEGVIGNPQNILLEVGPGQTLCQLAGQHPKRAKDTVAIPSLGQAGKEKDDAAAMLAALGRLWIAGLDVKWESFYAHEKRRRIPLTSYPFERKRCWVEPPQINAFTFQENPMPLAQTAENHVEETSMGDVLISEQVVPLARKERLINELRDLFQGYSGTDHSQTDENESFMDLGIDSLLLTQISQGVLKRFKVKVTFRQMLEDFCSLSALADYLDEKLPPDAPPKQELPAPSASFQPKANPQPAAVFNQLSASASLQSPPAAGGTLLESVIQQQMAIMSQQLELLRQPGISGGALPAAHLAAAHSASGPKKPTITAVNLDKHSQFGPFKAIEKGPAGGLTDRQKTGLDVLIKRYNQRTAKSKAIAQAHRSYFCDPRAAGNFRQLWKEMVYPIVCAKSEGSRIWDIDGNEYIDVTMGFGANYLGHSPDFVMKALKAQMKRGVEIGPQSPIAGEVAEMICQFTGMDRATFCNTGSEAVMAAIRVSRTVTGREKIVYFQGDYHGIFDEVLGRPALYDGRPGAMPIAPGIPPLPNVIILEYGSPSSLETICNMADEIAAVLIEPVQARHPDLQPRDFLKELRRLTKEKEIALIFDEVITGFRVAPGGAQEYYGIKADLATYGKVVGGGMPIGVLAGSADFMDALDGGFWQFGDDSSPPAGVTFFAGTFVRHPLAMAAAHAVLKYLKSAGPSLQEQTNQRNARFVEGVNRFLQTRHLPMRLQSFSAIFYYDFHPDLKFANLLFYYLRDRGIHIWEGRVGTLSVAHTDEDMARVQRAFVESIEEMQSSGFLPEGDHNGGLRIARGDEAIKPEGGSVFSPPAVDSNRFPLAEAQREMWIGAQMRPEAAGPHHACTGLYLDGELDLDRLKRAIHLVVQRHEGLRCTFSTDGTEAILNSSYAPDIPVHDFTGLSLAEQDAGVNEILHREARRLFDLEKGPLIDFQVLKLSPRRHLLIFTAQMIVCDGWSHYVVFEDMAAVYSCLVEGKEPSLPPAVQMREYARWQQNNAGTDEARACEAFWMSQFETVPLPINLPMDHPRPPARTFEGDRREVTLPRELYQGIKRLAREQKNSYFAVLLSVFQVWLNRLSGARDLVVGVPFAAQGQLGMDSLVGQCANILPLRNRLDPEEAFTDVLRKAWASVLDAQEHWDFTYGRLISQLALPRDPSRIPLVSILFNIDPPMAKVKFSNLTHRFITGPRYYFQYDLGLNLVEDEGTIRVECDYNRNMFDGQIIQEWVNSYQVLLEAVVENPERPISTLPMLTDPKAGQIVGVGPPEAPDPPFGTVHALIEAQARQDQEKTAVSSQSLSLTYQEVDRRSSIIARHLQTLGIGPGTRVGVCSELSAHVPVALLAVLKAGGAYVGMDPSSPREQLSYILNDTSMPVVLVSDDAASCLPESSPRVLRFIQFATGNLTDDKDAPAFSAKPDDLACIIYKSGPGGELQGVEITHRALVNFLLSMKQKPGLCADDVFLCHSPLSFHREAFELLLPLAAGARSVIVPEISVLDPESLASLIEKHGITAMQATPSAWRLLVSSGWKGNRGLKAICHAEALRSDLAPRLASLCAEVWNIYGSVETTFAAMVGRVHADAPVTFGHVINNTRVMLVDAVLESVPVGAPGQILIAGPGLARSYRGAFPTIDEKFALRSIQGRETRLFLTGDMARYNSSGEVEFVERCADRIEISGSIIEPSQIELVLRGHAAVQDVTVFFLEDMGGKPGLVAYVSTENLGPTEHKEIARELGRLVRSALPEYMRPDRIVMLNALPRLADGKIDRLALPQPEEEEPELEDIVDPRNETEETLGRIWRELLNLPRVNVKDSFFDLGGKSLLAVNLFMRIEQEFSIKLPLATLFRAPTIEQLARLITSGDGSSSTWPSLVPIQPEGRTTPLFLVHGAGGNVLLYRALAHLLAPQYPVYGLQSQGLDGQSKPLRTVEEMARRYLEEIRMVQPKGPYLLGGYCLGGTIAYEMAQILVSSGEEVSLVAMLDTYNFNRALKVSFISFLLQKFRFHWSNFIKLRPRVMWRYLREKRRIASNGGWAHIRTERPGSTLQDGVARAETGTEASVQAINDHAGDIYTPKPYPGILTLFKPHINYKFYPDPKMGWEDLALGGLDIVELPINPHAMLVEPYVELLAQELRIRLERYTAI